MHGGGEPALSALSSEVRPINWQRITHGWGLAGLRPLNNCNGETGKLQLPSWDEGSQRALGVHPWVPLAPPLTSWVTTSNRLASRSLLCTMGMHVGPSVNHIVNGMLTPLPSLKKALPDPRNLEQHQEQHHYPPSFMTKEEEVSPSFVSPLREVIAFEPREGDGIIPRLQWQTQFP